MRKSADDEPFGCDVEEGIGGRGATVLEKDSVGDGLCGGLDFLDGA